MGTGTPWGHLPGPQPSRDRDLGEWGCSPCPPSKATRQGQEGGDPHSGEGVSSPFVPFGCQ